MRHATCKIGKNNSNEFYAKSSFCQLILFSYTSWVGIDLFIAINGTWQCKLFDLILNTYVVYPL